MAVAAAGDVAFVVRSGSRIAKDPAICDSCSNGITFTFCARIHIRNAVHCLYGPVSCSEFVLHLGTNCTIVNLQQEVAVGLAATRILQS